MTNYSDTTWTNHTGKHKVFWTALMGVRKCEGDQGRRREKVRGKGEKEG